MKAALYCRVSTEDQEREGTSLQTQLEACREYCLGKSYEIAYRISESFTGLTLERPKLNELREFVRNDAFDVLVIYCLDRLSRDPTHGAILQDELEKHSVTLESVTEDIDSSDLGKLISYIRGYAAKLEAEKIKERTVRGKKAKARSGQIPSGGFARTYGYDYIKIAHKNGGRRVINEDEAKWVRKIFNWLVNDGMSTTAITHQLIVMGVPTKCGKQWCKQAVRNILRNPAYMGKTYAFTTAKHKQFNKPQSEWIEIPNVTPSIIEPAMFEAAQKQLQLNQQNAMRNMKYQYLLRGHVFCKRCRRPFSGWASGRRVGNERKLVTRYRCSGTSKLVEPFNKCTSNSWRADKLETLVWQQIEQVLNNPELIITEIEKQRQDANQTSFLVDELRQVERQLRVLNQDQQQLLQWAIKGFPEETVVAENKRINERRENLQVQKAELETQIKTSQEAAISLPKLGHFVELMRQKLTTLDFETKRLALEMLGIKVWLDGQNVEITGTLPVPDDAIVTIQSLLAHPLLWSALFCSVAVVATV